MHNRFNVKPIDYLLGAYFVVCALALTWPVYPWVGNRIEPYLLGLPMSFMWNVGWVVLTFLVISGYHFASGHER